MDIYDVRGRWIAPEQETIMTGWEHVAFVKSRTEKTPHEIKRRGDTLGCDCLSYRFKKGDKTCYHITALMASMASVAGGTEVQVQTKHSLETFTVVRRAIRVGGMR